MNDLKYILQAAIPFVLILALIYTWVPQ